eukprot:10635355-Lingulodinium_polyedra.AAC.1
MKETERGMHKTTQSLGMNDRAERSKPPYKTKLPTCIASREACQAANCPRSRQEEGLGTSA